MIMSHAYRPSISNSFSQFLHTHTRLRVPPTLRHSSPSTPSGDTDVKVLTLAEQIIAAMPERIKHEADDLSMHCHSPGICGADDATALALADTFMEPLLDTSSLPSHSIDTEFCFEFSDQTYRYHDNGTPCSSLSPASSSGPLQSPASYTAASAFGGFGGGIDAITAAMTATTATTTTKAAGQMRLPGLSLGSASDGGRSSPSPPPTTAEFSEFLQASSAATAAGGGSASGNPFESAFSNLTLTDVEQRELYEAAKCIQKAYRSYKGRKKLEEDKERSAAILIQNYYRRYKQVGVCGERLNSSTRVFVGSVIL